MAKVRALDMEKLTAREVMDYIVACLPSSLDVKNRERLSSYFSKASAALPRNTCYSASGDKVIAKRQSRFSKEGVKQQGGRDKENLDVSDIDGFSFISDELDKLFV